MSDLLLIGYSHSVYTRAVRIALAELALDYHWQEADPFEQEVALHPFGQVPVLVADGLRIYETWAILIYLDACYGDTQSQPDPDQALRLARAAQVAGIVNAHVYWPLVRQVYVNAVFAPAKGETPIPDEIVAGFARADRVLDALEEIACEAVVLNGKSFGPADWLLFPMIDAFRRAPGAQAVLQSRPTLNDWWTALSTRRTVSDTFTSLDEGGEGSSKGARN